MLAIEPRMLFDGAAMALAADAPEAPPIIQRGPEHAPEARPDEYFIDSGREISDGQAIAGHQDPAEPWHDDSQDFGDGLFVSGVKAGNSTDPVVGGVGQSIEGRYGSLTLQSDGSYQYVPNAAGRNLVRDTRADDYFTYTLTDQYGHRGTTTIRVNLIGLNAAPQALPHDRAISGGERQILDGSLLTNDGHGNPGATDPEGDRLLVTGIVAGDADTVPAGGLDGAIQGRHGSLTLSADGQYRYTLNAGVTAAAGQVWHDTFSYQVSDKYGASTVSTITIRIGSDQIGAPTPSAFAAARLADLRSPGDSRSSADRPEGSTAGESRAAVPHPSSLRTGGDRELTLLIVLPVEQDNASPTRAAEPARSTDYVKPRPKTVAGRSEQDCDRQPPAPKAKPRIVAPNLFAKPASDARPTAETSFSEKVGNAAKKLPRPLPSRTC